MENLKHPIERIYGADLVARFIESWSLKEFLENHGPKLQIKSYPITNEGAVSFMRCRFGDTNKEWVYTYISLRIKEVTPEYIIKNKYNIRVGKTDLGDYVLYDNGGDWNWIPVNVTF